MAVEDDFVHVDISEGSDALIEEDTTCDDGRTLDVDQKRKVLLAQHSPVPLDVAVEVLTRKREKPPSERGRWGKKKESTTKGETKAKKVKPEKVKAKRAPSAYILYCNEARSKLPEGLKVPEQAKLLGAQWKALDEKERVKFEKMAGEAKAAIADAAPETKAKGKERTVSQSQSVSHRRTSCTATRRGRSFPRASRCPSRRSCSGRSGRLWMRWRRRGSKGWRPMRS